MKIKNFFRRLDLTVYSSTMAPIAALLISFPIIMFAPESWAEENSILENAQLAILAAAIVICLLAKANDNTPPPYTREGTRLRDNADNPLFKWLAMVCAVLFLREINCGRVFFPIQGRLNAFRRWDEIMPGYGRLVPAAYAAFMAWTVVYALKERLWKPIRRIILTAHIPFWDFTLLGVGMIFGTLGENILNNEILEECAETIFYIALVSIVYLYANVREFSTDAHDYETPAREAVESLPITTFSGLP
jgi:hypothetical protein